MEQGEYILEMKGITKCFPGVKALDNVSINLKKGEVLALIGENGAGKSTLVSILMGQHQPDEGEIWLENKKAVFSSQAAALASGVSMIYQELNPILDMSIADNIFLNRTDKFKNTPFINRKQVWEKTEKLLKEYGVNYHPNTHMRDLSMADCQMIEIIKAVSYHSKIIIMDEPTSSLSDAEAKKLFDAVRELRDSGIGIIYISHRMEEVFDLADRVTILRDGRFIETSEVGEVSNAQLINHMVGRELDSLFPKLLCDIGEVVLETKSLTSTGVFEDISLQVHKGEILGISGLVGAGRSEIVKAIFGLDSYTSGEIFLDGRSIKNKSTRQAIDRGIAMVSEDRKKYGLVLCRSIRENSSLAHIGMFCKRLFVNSYINKHREQVECKKISTEMSLKYSTLEQPASSLSGGNQQKVVLAKWLIKQPKVLILDEPTRGIDVGAKAEIHRMMSELAQKGMAIIMISSELPEILGMSDRILVVCNGRIQGEFTSKDATQEKILMCALGG